MVSSPKTTSPPKAVLSSDTKPIKSDTKPKNGTSYVRKAKSNGLDWTLAFKTRKEENLKNKIAPKIPPQPFFGRPNLTVKHPLYVYFPTLKVITCDGKINDSRVNDICNGSGSGSVLLEETQKTSRTDRLIEKGDTVVLYFASMQSEPCRKFMKMLSKVVMCLPYNSIKLILISKDSTSREWKKHCETLFNHHGMVKFNFSTFLAADFDPPTLHQIFIKFNVKNLPQLKLVDNKLNHVHPSCELPQFVLSRTNCLVQEVCGLAEPLTSTRNDMRETPGILKRFVEILKTFSGSDYQLSDGYGKVKYLMSGDTGRWHPAAYVDGQEEGQGGQDTDSRNKDVTMRNKNVIIRLKNSGDSSKSTGIYRNVPESQIFPYDIEEYIDVIINERKTKDDKTSSPEKKDEKASIDKTKILRLELFSLYVRRCCSYSTKTGGWSMLGYSSGVKDKIEEYYQNIVLDKTEKKAKEDEIEKKTKEDDIREFILDSDEGWRIFYSQKTADQTEYIGLPARGMVELKRRLKKKIEKKIEEGEINNSVIGEGIVTPSATKNSFLCTLKKYNTIPIDILDECLLELNREGLVFENDKKKFSNKFSKSTYQPPVIKESARFDFKVKEAMKRKGEKIDESIFEYDKQGMREDQKFNLNNLKSAAGGLAANGFNVQVEFWKSKGERAKVKQGGKADENNTNSKENKETTNGQEKDGMCTKDRVRTKDREKTVCDMTCKKNDEDIKKDIKKAYDRKKDADTNNVCKEVDAERTSLIIEPNRLVDSITIEEIPEPDLNILPFITSAEICCSVGVIMATKLGKLGKLSNEIRQVKNEKLTRELTLAINSREKMVVSPEEVGLYH